MGESKPQISDAEWDVMEVIWALGASTPAEIIDRVATARQWNHRTVRTLLSRLVEKGALRREVNGPRSVYRAAVSRRSCVREEGRTFLNKVFGGDATSLIVHFAKGARIPPEDISRLKRVLDEKTAEGEP
jgi:BlaI family penicillinase repressor